MPPPALLAATFASTAVGCGAVGSMAGLRAGFVAGDPALVAALAAQQPHWSVGSLALRSMIETATPRARALVATRSMPARTSSCSQCCGSPIRALVASRMSRMFSISSSSVRKDSRRGHDMFATSPPETTTSRTDGVRRR